MNIAEGGKGGGNTIAGYTKEQLEEFGRKISIKTKGRTPWNKGIVGDYISGEKNPFYNKHHTIETRERISKKRKDYYKYNESFQSGKIWINNGTKQTYIEKSLLNEYEKNGYKRGMLKRKNNN